MPPRLLIDEEFHATMTPKMHDVTHDNTAFIDIWPYVDSLPLGDLEGHSLGDGAVNLVYRTEDDRYDHILLCTNADNVYLAVVVDLGHGIVYGHLLLDLNRKYGLS